MWPEHPAHGSRPRAVASCAALPAPEAWPPIAPGDDGPEVRRNLGLPGARISRSASADFSPGRAAGEGLMGLEPIRQDGGEGGIRTHGTGTTHTHAFQACSLSHSDTSPACWNSTIINGGGGIRTHVPGSSPDNPISSRARYDHFGTPPDPFTKGS